jgi:ATP-dependent DNA ligase
MAQFMLCSASESLPIGTDWTYEPKLDGFRGLLIRHGSRVDLRSRNDKSLAAYFPEIVRAANEYLPRPAVHPGRVAVDLLAATIPGDFLRK